MASSVLHLTDHNAELTQEQLYAPYVLSEDLNDRRHYFWVLYWRLVQRNPYASRDSIIVYLVKAILEFTSLGYRDAYTDIFISLQVVLHLEGDEELWQRV